MFFFFFVSSRIHSSNTDFFFRILMFAHNFSIFSKSKSSLSLVHRATAVIAIHLDDDFFLTDRFFLIHFCTVRIFVEYFFAEEAVSLLSADFSSISARSIFVEYFFAEEAVSLLSADFSSISARSIFVEYFFAEDGRPDLFSLHEISRGRSCSFPLRHRTRSRKSSLTTFPSQTSGLWQRSFLPGAHLLTSSCRRMSFSASFSGFVFFQILIEPFRFWLRVCLLCRRVRFARRKLFSSLRFWHFFQQPRI